MWQFYLNTCYILSMCAALWLAENARLLRSKCLLEICLFLLEMPSCMDTVWRRIYLIIFTFLLYPLLNDIKLHWFTFHTGTDSSWLLSSVWCLDRADDRVRDAVHVRQTAGGRGETAPRCGQHTHRYPATAGSYRQTSRGSQVREESIMQRHDVLKEFSV